MDSKKVTNLTTYKSNEGTPNIQLPTDIQVGTMNGKNFIYPHNIQPKNNLPNPINTPLPEDNPPPYSAHIVHVNSGSRSMDETNIITSELNLAYLSPENNKRRSFFFLLKDRLTECISSSPFITFCDTSYDNTGLSECNQTSCCPCSLSVFPNCGTSESEGIRQFATRLALGFTYMYQDIIPLLDTESNNRLTKYFVLLINIDFFDNRHCCSDNRTFSIYSLLMNSLNLYFPRNENCNVKNLKTVDGFTFSFNHLLSLGVCTIDGDLYEATNKRNVKLFTELKDRNNIPRYRWGTSDAIKIDLILDNLPNKIHLREVEGSVSDHIDLVREISKANLCRGTGFQYLPNALASEFTKFWDRADALAINYLSQDEFRSFTQLIPAGRKSIYLLREQGPSESDGGGGS